MSVVMPRVMTRGVVFIHSTPTALCPHIAWALEGVLDTRVSLDWVPQPAQPGTMRTEFSWTGEAGTGALIASAMRGWDGLRYEVVEEASRGSDGMRWTHTPALGIHQARLSANGDVVVNEDRLRTLLEASAGSAATLVAELDRALGAAWDAELEQFRHAGEGAPPTWLHKVG
ncbi:DUF3145 domain-containing protein [Ornithinimicrobium pekingense]|uniref:DUF3145 domain-containing protein n=1 Tax=Ornithinimicrobium pekingense TaxID=384677 RepID=A0ABQ2F7H1_9MICO|nr:DUF3145 domain-containing protein [Ornithinimicrobium pekingense]GGK61373.1 hypothetical protein GCM10011509_07190 [Ornithinimicrobium pekingense]